MNTILVIARRELTGYLLSPLGYIIMAALLLLDGLAFNGIAMQGQKTSYEVLQMFFFYSCGFVAAAGVLFAMRLFAEERQAGTLVLLTTSPATELELVLGKFLGGFGFLSLFIALTFYMPLLVLVNGKVTWGHVLVGYLGLFLLGAAVTAIGTFASTIAKTQILSAVIAGVIVVALFVCWMVAQKVDGVLGDAIGYLDLFDKHYRSFTRGILKLSSVTYLLSLTYVGLMGAVLVLTSRRWRDG
jgi:ABC-2 type transport system permease protein